MNRCSSWSVGFYGEAVAKQRSIFQKKKKKGKLTGWKNQMQERDSNR
jgi:hypothetical protein